MSCCRWVYLSVVKRAVPVPSIYRFAAEKCACFIKQMRSCLWLIKGSNTLSLSRMHSVLQTFQGCIVTKRKSFVRHRHVLDCRLILFSMHQAYHAYISHFCMYCHHDEVVWYAVMHLNAASSNRCLRKWPVVQMRTHLSHARGAIISTKRVPQKKRSANIKSNFGEEEQRRRTGGWRKKRKKVRCVGGWRKRKVKRIGRFLQYCCC